MNISKLLERPNARGKERLSSIHTLKTTKCCESSISMSIPKLASKVMSHYCG